MQERVLFFMRGLCLVLASGSLCLSTARAESTNPVIDALHEKLVSHFQGGGYTVSDSGYGRKTLRKSVSEDGGTETVTEIVRRPRTRTTYQKTESGRTVRVNGKPVKITTTTIIETSREYTRSLGSFSSDVKIELSVTPLPDSAERLADMTAQALSQRQKTRLEMERQSATLGTGLNQVAHSHQTQWPEADGYMHGLRLFENARVFEESKDGCLAGELNTMKQPYSGSQLLSSSRMDQTLTLSFFTSQALCRLTVWVHLSGSGNLEGRASGTSAMDLLREAYLAVTGKNLSLTLPASLNPGLVLEASQTSLPADGQSTVQITGSLRDVSADLDPGTTLLFEILPEEGKTPGSLSADTVPLDARGQASVTYTAPDARLFPESPKRAMVKVSCEALGFEDIQCLDLESYEPLKVSFEHSILPAHQDFYGGLTFSFGAPGEGQVGKSYRTAIKATSSGGRLVTEKQKLAGSEGSRELLLNAEPGVNNTLYYHYVGDAPQAGAIEEVVTLEVLDRQQRGRVTLSVGIDLALVNVEPLWREGLMPGMMIPLRSRLEDRYHPEADVKALLETFDILPNLTIVQKSFVPITVSAKDDAFCSQLLHHVTGAVIPRGATVRDVTAGSVLRGRGDEDGWLLVNTFSGQGSTFPGVIPWDMGSYQFEAVLDLHWAGDATDLNHSVIMAPLNVSQSGSGDAMMDDFFIPTLKSWIGLTSAGGSLSTAFEVAQAIHEQRDNPKEAALAGIASLASSVAQDLASGWAGDAMKSRLLKKEFRAYVSKAMDIPLETLDDVTFNKAMKAVGDRYWAGNAFDTLLGVALNKAKAAVSAAGSGLDDPESVSTAGQASLNDALAFGSAFLQGQGGTSMVIAVGAGAEILVVKDGQDRVLENAPEQMFTVGDHHERVYRSPGRMVVPVKEGEKTIVNVPAGTEGVTLYEVRSHGHSVSQVEALNRSSQAIFSGGGIVQK